MPDINSSNTSNKRRIAIITTHPIQYNAPLFHLLAMSSDFAIKVFYTWGEKSIHVFDPGFGKERSWDIDLLTGYDHTFVENISKEPGSYHYRGINNPSLINEISLFKPDAIVVYGWKFHSHLKAMRYFKGKVPILFRGDSTILNEKSGFSLNKFLRRLILKIIYRNVDFALSPGYASDDYYNFVGLKNQQIFRAPHAIHNERFAGGEEFGNTEKKEYLDIQAQNWLQMLSINHDTKVFMFAGKFEKVKNPLLIIGAFKCLLKLRTDIHLILVGDGHLKDEIISNLANVPPIYFTILPFQNQTKMPVLYRMCKVFMLTSISETWGLAINEAMACGRAVIASDKCGGAKDLIETGKNGYVFESGNKDDLVEKMKLCLEEDRYLSMGDYSRQKIKEFTYEHFLVALNSIFSCNG